jgi:hypothetical protein
VRALLSGVTSGWIAAVVGLVGAVVGAGATLTANWLTARTQLMLASGNREQQRAEVRRGACAEYLTAADSFMDQARELVSRMESNTPAPELNTAHATYFAGWETLQRACSPVVIAGPAELGELAEAFKSQLGALGDECDSWYAAHKSGAARSRATKFSSVQHAAYEARAAFISAAQKHAHADPGPEIARSTRICG